MKTRAAAASLAAAIAALLAAGCERIAGDYMPLAVGNRWDYSVRWQRGEAPAEAAADFMEIIDEVAPGKFRAREAAATSLWSKELGFVIRADGTTREPILALPPHTGYKWKLNTPAGSVFSEIAERCEVSVPAGRFADCLRVVQRDVTGRRVLNYWFAPGVGIVKAVLLYSGTPVETRELLRWRLAPGAGAGTGSEPKGPAAPEPEPPGPGGAELPPAAVP